jgi:hypothetical protein
LVHQLTLEFEADISALGANVEKQITGCRDRGVFCAFDLAEGVQF